MIRDRRGIIDLEAKLKPSLLNMAIYLMGLSKQVTLFWGLVGAGAVTFGGAIDFMLELNWWLQIVEMKPAVCPHYIINIVLMK
jgi:cation-transporting ATPase 13A1